MASLKKLGDKLGLAQKKEKKSKKEKKKKRHENAGDGKAEVTNGSAEEPAVEEGRRARVLFDYEPEQDDEIALTPGDIIMVYDQDESGWWTGEIGDQYGLFPGAFVEFIDGPTDENYDFLKSTGDEEEQRALREIAKPERTVSSDRVTAPAAAASPTSAAEIELLKSRLSASEESRAALQAQVEQLKSAASAAPVSTLAASGDEVAILRSQVHTLQHELAQLRVEKQRLEQSAVADAAELNSLRKARAESEGNTSIMRASLEASQAEVSKAKTERDAALERARQLQGSSSSASLEAELQAQKAAYAQLQQELAKAKAAPSATSSDSTVGSRIAEQRLEAQVRDLKAALEKEQAEKARLLEVMKHEARATVRVAAEKRPPPASPKPSHLVNSPSGSRAFIAAPPSPSGSTTERPSIPPRRSIVTQPVNPESNLAAEREAWQEKKLKPTGLLAQLP